MYKKVLVPLDGTEISEYSISHVESIAMGCKVPDIVLIRVVEPMPVYAEIPDEQRIQIDKKARTGAIEYLEKIAKGLKKYDIKVQTVTAVGADPATEILEYTRKNKVDLIILTKHSHSGLLKWLIGSVAERVVRNSAVSVLLVSPEK